MLRHTGIQPSSALCTCVTCGHVNWLASTLMRSLALLLLSVVLALQMAAFVCNRQSTCAWCQ
jgi:hypothetical protein